MIEIGVPVGVIVVTILGITTIIELILFSIMVITEEI